jgi:hypothetical protein
VKVAGSKNDSMYMATELMVASLAVEQKKSRHPLTARRQGGKPSIYRDLVEKYQSFMA